MNFHAGSKTGPEYQFTFYGYPGNAVHLDAGLREDSFLDRGSRAVLDIL